MNCITASTPLLSLLGAPDSPDMTTAKLSAEFELILQCVRRQLDQINAAGATQALGGVGEDCLAPIQVDADKVDWEQIPRLAWRHKLAPVVYSGVSSLKSPDVPGEIIANLRKTNSAVVRESMALAGELVRIVRLFRKANLPIVAFKGPTLASDLYGGLHCRQFIDLDLLIRPRDLFPALQIFDELGYRLNGPSLQHMDRRHLPSFLARFNDQALVRQTPTGRSIVELHWRFTNDPSFFTTDYDVIFDMPNFTSLGGQKVQILAPCQQLIYLAFHCTKHQCTRLSWLCDFALALNRMSPAEWTKVICEATPTAQRCLIAAVLMLEQLGLVSNLKDRGIDFVHWRRGMKPVLSTMLGALTADEAFRPTATFKLVFWRARLSGKWRPFLVPPLRYMLPQPDDLAKGGRVRPYLSRWYYLVIFWPRLLRKACIGLKDAE